MYFFSSHMSVSLNLKEVQLNWAIDFSWIFEDSKSLKPKTTRDYYVQRHRTISPQEIVINNTN